MGASSSKDAPAKSQAAPPSYWSIVRQGYDELVNAIIRPPRAEYDIEQLGPTRFTYLGKTFVRTDLVLVNQRGLALQCSHWEPEDRPADELPCVVFMHGNSSARLEGLNQLAVCLSFGVTLFSFDCAGSGKSEGTHVSLGWWEREDLRVAVDHLRGSGSVAKIAVWGRSMGAVTGLLYQVQDAELLEGDMSVNAMVLDSPFADFCQLAEELVAKGRDRGVVVPSVVTRMALTMLGNSVQSIAGFSIHDLSARRCVGRCHLPALFICAKHDDFIGTHHTLALHAAYAGPKELIVADGDHNTLRSSKSLLAVGLFLQKALQVPNDWALQQPTAATKAGALKPASYSSLPWRPQQRRPGAEQEVGFSRSKVDGLHGTIGKAMGAAGFDDDSSSSSFQCASSSSNGEAAPAAPAPKRTKQEQQWCVDQAHYYCNRGNTLEEHGKIDAAIRAYRAAITYHADYPDAHYNLGIALKNRGFIDEAIREYRRTIAIKADHADAHNNLGVALEEKGSVDMAIAAYEAAIKFNPKHSEAHCNLADALQSVGRLGDAIREYHTAIAQNPGDADTINNLGVALEAQGQINEAILAYQTAVANKPEHWDAQCNLADALHLRGEFERAADVYRFILKFNPTNAQIASSLGNVLHASGQHAEALDAYEVAVKFNALDTITHNNMGIVLQTMGEVDRAIEAYNAALAHDDTYAIAHYNLGVALQSVSRLDEAIAAYEAAVTHRPNYADAYNNMGYALQQRGDLAAAVVAYEQAIEARPAFASAQANLKSAQQLLLAGKPPANPTPRQPAPKAPPPSGKPSTAAAAAAHAPPLAAAAAAARKDNAQTNVPAPDADRTRLAIIGGPDDDVTKKGPATPQRGPANNKRDAPLSSPSKADRATMPPTAKSFLGSVFGDGWGF